MNHLGKVIKEIRNKKGITAEDIYRTNVKIHVL